MFRHFLIVSVAVLLQSAASPVWAAELCIEDWSTAVPVVKEERLASVATVMSLGKERVKGDIIKVTLCRDGERWVYRLLVRQPNGKHQPMIIDARQPFGR